MEIGNIAWLSQSDWREWELEVTYTWNVKWLGYLFLIILYSFCSWMRTRPFSWIFRKWQTVKLPSKWRWYWMHSHWRLASLRSTHANQSWKICKQIPGSNSGTWFLSENSEIIVGILPLPLRGQNWNGIPKLNNECYLAKKMKSWSNF